MMRSKCCIICQHIGRPSSGHRTGKGQYSSQFGRRVVPKIVWTTSRLLSSHMLANNAQNSPSQASKVHVPWTSRCSSWIYKKQRNQKSNCQHPLDNEKVREFQKNIYFCFIDYAKAFDCVDHHKLWRILRDGNTRPPDLPPEKSVYRSRNNS